MNIKKYTPYFILLLSAVIFFWKTIFYGYIPAPLDALVGLYHPFRDYYSKDYPNGIPYKNFLITDPVRQQLPWRYEAIQQIKSGIIPYWNPYSFSGYPLLANLQSAVFYPLNIIFFFISFKWGWTLLVILQPILAGSFMYLYLSNRKFSYASSLIGALSFAYSGVMISWLTWNTIDHVLLYTPLLFYLIDKLSYISNIKNRFLFQLIFISATASSFFAGHIQMFLYTQLLVLSYILLKILIQKSKRYILINQFIVLYGIVLIVTSVQWIPFVQLLLNSARNIDQIYTHKNGWFIPIIQLAQFIAPDFFGSPATLNYFGEWNYGEMVGYIGIIGLLFSLFACTFFRLSRLVKFCVFFVIVSLLFSIKNPLSIWIYSLNIPFFVTAQPTRLLSIIEFCLSVLSAFGFEMLFFKKKYTNYFNKIIGFMMILFLFLFMLTFTLSSKHSLVSRRNLIFPFSIFSLFYMLYFFHKKVSKKYSEVLYFFFIILVMFDLLRFGLKYTPFSHKEYLYPETKIISYLKKNNKPYRVLATDNKIFPPNVNVFYQIPMLDGYDPLYLSIYSAFASSLVRNKSDMTPMSFNRIITIHDYTNPIVRMANVGFIATFDTIDDPSYELVEEEGSVKLYRDTKAFPRLYFADEIIQVSNPSQGMKVMYDNISFKKIAVVYDRVIARNISNQDKFDIMTYNANEIKIRSNTNDSRFLVLSEVFYPSRRAYIDGQRVKIYKTNIVYQGVFVPRGVHEIVFKNNLW